MTRKSPETGLYLHVPFCKARCGYCDFTTFTGQESQIDRYVDALCDEIRLYVGAGPCACPKSDSDSSPESNLIAGGRGDPPLRLNISTVFFGGGTPSLLEPSQVQTVLDAIRHSFDLAPDAEITLEANPESLTREKADGWRAAGVNRLSIGLQAFDNTLLKKMDRLHTVEAFLSAFQNARQAGFDNLSIDLIYGFSGQSLEDWKQTVKATLDIEPEHLSLYALAVEEHTPFKAQGHQINNDQQGDMYEWARTAVAARGFEQYEISNFAKPGRACRHNLIYWRQQDYLGFGVGAVGSIGPVGCEDGIRWQNEKSLGGYFKTIEDKRLPRISEERLDEKTRQFERLMLGLRLREGLAWDSSWNPTWQTHRTALVTRHLLEEVRPGFWRIPDHAVALTNQVLMPFIG
jgi:oxygen-independent coproporphyrinogen III oxidase